MGKALPAHSVGATAGSPSIYISNPVVGGRGAEPGGVSIHTTILRGWRLCRQNAALVSGCPPPMLLPRGDFAGVTKVTN